jgi:hypothetical protein
VTGQLEKGKEAGYYSIRFVALGKELRAENRIYKYPPDWQTRYGTYVKLDFKDLPLYLDLPNKFPLFDKIISGQYKRI